MPTGLRVPCHGNLAVRRGEAGRVTGLSDSKAGKSLRLSFQGFEV